MIKYQDLNIEKEIIPLFDFTLNNYSKNLLLEVFQDELVNIEEIHLRQQVLNAFLDNFTIFSNYYYSKTDFVEVYNFLHELDYHENFYNKNVLFIFSKSKIDRIKARFKQFLLLFNRLEKFYFSKITNNPFPEYYRHDINKIKNFISSFQLSNYELLLAENKITLKVLKPISKLILDKIKNGELDQFYKSLFLFEVYLSISIGINRSGFNFPQITTSSFSFEGLFHPSLNAPVNNSFLVDRNLFVLTGPNMSGKSTLLKSIGISVYLTKIGLAIPAANASIPFFDDITISINHNDNIKNGYSHFMKEIMTLKQVLINLKEGKKVLAIFDEFLSGTNSEDANKIIATTIKGLENIKDSYLFFSTHLNQIEGVKITNTNNIGIYSMDCKIENKAPIFKFKLIPGWSVLKVGQLLFEMEGLNQLLNLL